WLVFIPPIVMIVIAAVVLIARSDVTKIVGITILVFPWFPVAIGPVVSKIQDYMTDRSIAGDDRFGGKQRELAHAITARNADLAKTLIPQAGDLNKQYGND